MSGMEPKSFDLSGWGPVIVSVLVLSIFLSAIVIAWWTKDTSLQVLLGMAGTNAGTAVGYWLGSSSGSKSKDSLLASQATTTTTIAPPNTVTTTTGNTTP